MITGPSKHLTWNELACKDGTPYPEEWRLNRAIQLAEIFEEIRFTCSGKSIKVLSAYRTPEWNHKIGGARHSQHMEGRALDLKSPDNMSLIAFYHIIKELASVMSIKGLGKYKTFVHIDIRPSDRLVVWSGTGVKDS